jgi:hypothetical protein
LLFLNNIASIDEFVLQDVILPPYPIILNIARDNKNIADIIDLSIANIDNSNQYVDVYFPKANPV